MDRERLNRELAELWQRVRLSEPGPEASELGIPASSAGGPSSSSEMTQTLLFLKRQHEREAGRWEELVAAKDRALRELSGRLKAAEGELLDVTERSRHQESRLLDEVLKLSLKLEEFDRAAGGQREHWEREVQVLKGALGAARQALASELVRRRETEAEAAAKEGEDLAQIRELEASCARLAEDSRTRQEKTNELLANLKEAESAIQKTLVELLEERRSRHAAEEERRKALEKVAEVESHFKELSKLWEEERSQWRELWDRERSTWETQRSEFAAWEGKLRGERETWQQEIRLQEGKVTRHLAQMGQALKYSTESSLRLGKLLRFLGLKLPESAELSLYKAFYRTRRRRLAALAAGIVLALSSYPAYLWLGRVSLRLQASFPLEAANPTHLAYDGSLLWLAEWEGRLSAFSPEDPARALKSAEVRGAGPYHPISLAWSQDLLWSLDSAQGRILQHPWSDPSRVEVSAPAPGPATSALAYDGGRLWSYDAAGRVLYRYERDIKARPAAFPVEVDMVPASMAWVGRQLWILDSKGHRLLRFKLRGEEVRLAGEQTIDPALLSFVVLPPSRPGERTLWAVSGPSRGDPRITLRKYLVRP